MNILFVVHQFFPNHYTGSERLVLNLCKQFQRCGHRVKVLTYGITDTDFNESYNGILINRYYYENVAVISVRHESIPEMINFQIFDPKMQPFFKEILKEERADIVHVCHPMRLGSIVPTAHELHIPIILTLTDFWLMCPRGIAITQGGALCKGSETGKNCLKDCYVGSYWEEKIETRFKNARVVFSCADAVVSGTWFLKAMFQNKEYRDDIKIIRFGKDQKNISKKNLKVYNEQSKITIGYLSSLNAHKGAHLLLDAYRQVNPPNISLKIFGDTGLNSDYFKVLKKIAGDNPGIKFCGKYDYAEMPEILEQIDITAVPSLWWENSPLVLLRSLAHNVPAIVSDLGGLTEIITDGVNGFTFSVGHTDSLTKNAQGLANILQKISIDPSILNKLKAQIKTPRRIEEEGFDYECLYNVVIRNPVKKDGFVNVKDGN